MSQPNPINIHALRGTFTVDDLNKDQSIKTSFVSGKNLETVEHAGINPARGLASTPLVFTSGFGQYSCARTIEELQGAVPEYPVLYWWLFTLVAIYRDVTFISFTVENPAVWTVYLETRDKKVFGWISPHVAQDGYVIEEEKEATEEWFMNPSEIMQAFTVTAEHIRMGSTRFAVNTVEETKRFFVSMFDYADKTLRYDVEFPLELPEAEKKDLH